MNNYNVIYTPHARANALRIVSYMQNILLSNQAAKNFISKLKEKETAIAKNPYGYQEEFFGRALYRKATVGQYIIAFRIEETAHTVHIIAIGHSRQKRRNIIKH